MRSRRLALGVVLALISILLFWAAAHAQGVDSDLTAANLIRYTNERVVVADTPVGLNVAKATDGNVVYVEVKAKGGTIIWTTTGQNPTTSYGDECVVGCVLKLHPTEAVLLLMIRENTSRTVTAIVTYYALKGAIPIP